MSTGYKLMLVFFVLAFIAGCVFLPGIGWAKYLGIIPLFVSLVIALSDKLKFDPDASTVWFVIIMGLAADFIPLILYVIVKSRIV